MAHISWRRPCLALAAITLVVGSGTALAGAVVGRPAPPFHATTFDGAKVRLEDFKGQVLVVNLWATWCGPCKRELPLLDAYFQHNAPHGLRVIAYTTEDSLPASYLRPLQAALKIPLARNFRGAYPAITGAVPSNYVIDRAGVVRYAKAGAFDLATLNAVLVPLMREPAPTGSPAS